MEDFEQHFSQWQWNYLKMGTWNEGRQKNKLYPWLSNMTKLCLKMAKKAMKNF